MRNWQVTGHFVPTTLQVGASLYDGLSPTANGSSNMSFAPVFETVQRLDDSNLPERPADSFEYRLDRRLRDEAWNWARTNQGRVVQLAFIKLVRIWNVWPNEAAFRAWPVRLLVACTYVPLLLGACYGIYRLHGRGQPLWLCWLPAVYVSLIHAVFVGSLRYREPAMLGLIIVAAAVWSGWPARTLVQPSSNLAG